MQNGALWLMGPCGLGEVLDFVLRALGSQARDAINCERSFQLWRVNLRGQERRLGRGPESSGMTKAQTGFMGMGSGDKAQKCHQNFWLFASLFALPRLFFPLLISLTKHLKLRYLLCIRLVPFSCCQVWQFASEVWWYWVRMGLAPCPCPGPGSSGSSQHPWDTPPGPVTDPLRASIHLSKIETVITAASWSSCKNLVKLFP